MQLKPSLLRSPHKRRSVAGFTLIELMVTLLIAGIMLSLTASFTSTVVSAQQNTTPSMEATQGLRSLLQAVTQELRQAGACLPRTGAFVALDGLNNGTQDRLILRIGQTTGDTLVCLNTSTSVPSPSGGTTFTVANGEGTKFEGVGLVYVLPPGNNGNFYTVAGVSPTTITINEVLSVPHQAGTGIYAVDERIYAIDTSTYGRPMLTVAMNGGGPQPLVDGAELFNIKYSIGPCEPVCAKEVDFPANDDEWQLVQAVKLKASVRSHKPDKNGNFPTATTGETSQVGEYLTIKPRNLL